MTMTMMMITECMEKKLQYGMEKTNVDKSKETKERI